MKNIILLLVIALLAVAAGAVTFYPVKDVNVVFNRCMDADELATVFHGTSFEAFEYYIVYADAAGGGVAGNEELFGTPLKGTALEEALSAEPRSTGIIVVDGRVSREDMETIKRSPFVDDVIVYYPILDRGDRNILSTSSTRYYSKHPEARYWE